MHINTMQKAQGACDSKGLHTDTNNADSRSHGAIQQAHDGKDHITRLTAVYTRIKAVAMRYREAPGLTLGNLFAALGWHAIVLGSVLYGFFARAA